MNTNHQTRKPLRLPPWLKRPLPACGKAAEVRRLLGQLHLATVCDSARCPNRPECFGRATAAFMILGNVCTRDCGFCAVPHGDPLPPDPGEPQAVAEAAARLGLVHVVVTSVTRDDLPDGGAARFAETIAAIRRGAPGATIEVLTPDFNGAPDAVEAVVQARPDVFNHNVETVRDLYPTVRPGADYDRSLDLLARAKRPSGTNRTPALTKSGLMLGLGESPRQVLALLRDLRRAGCDMLTIGQYLPPSGRHLPVKRFIPPDEFHAWQAAAEGLGFAAVAAGPFVRSSYRAQQLLRR